MSTAFPSDKTILAQTAHRPWSLPRRIWVMAQTWSHLLFAHWQVTPEALAPLIPAGLELDRFDGQAWIGVVPFEMSNVHPRGLVSLPKFPELNVRTYVVRDGKPGVWFVSLDAGNPIAVWVARLLFHLPYFRAEMRIDLDGDCVRYTSKRTDRRGASADFEAEYRPTTPVYRAADGSLDKWLTERYCLYSADKRGGLYRCEIHHVPWPLQRAEAQISVNTMYPALPDDPPLLHYAERIDVLTWYLERLA